MAYWLFIINAIFVGIGAICSFITLVTGEDAHALAHFLSIILAVVLIILFLKAAQIMGTFGFVMAIIAAIFHGIGAFGGMQSYSASTLVDIPLFVLFIIAACTCF